MFSLSLSYDIAGSQEYVKQGQKHLSECWNSYYLFTYTYNTYHQERKISCKTRKTFIVVMKIKEVLVPGQLEIASVKVPGNRAKGMAAQSSFKGNCVVSSFVFMIIKPLRHWMLLVQRQWMDILLKLDNLSDQRAPSPRLLYRSSLIQCYLGF